FAALFLKSECKGSAFIRIIQIFLQVFYVKKHLFLKPRCAIGTYKTCPLAPAATVFLQRMRIL
ncbi:MAG: hypothetical protein Q4C34_09760, partial [Bacteroidales bacterium]|nr:hypothetical protein [Bacteroidales bacterium]